jgi:hypothetical protein
MKDAECVDLEYSFFETQVPSRRWRVERWAPGRRLVIATEEEPPCGSDEGTLIAGNGERAEQARSKGARDEDATKATIFEGDFDPTGEAVD